MASIKLQGSTSGEITISAPAVAGTNTLTLPASTGEITTGGNNTPMFAVRLSGNQTISDNVITKIAYNVEDVDTDSAFDNSTNYRFTVPTGKAGKYKFDAYARLDALNNANLTTALMYLYINGAARRIVYDNYSTNQARAISVNLSCILDLAVGDYIEIYVACNTVNNADVTVNSNQYTQFSGHKLIG